MFRIDTLLVLVSRGPRLLAHRGFADELLLLAIGVLLLACNREPVPKYFGIYFQSSQGLREIPVKGDPAFNAAGVKLRSAFATKNPNEIKLAVTGFYDTCQTATEQPVFILYHETIKPPMLHFQRGTTKEEVEFGVTPVADKQFMYRLTPKQRLSKDVYVLSGSWEVVNNALACFLVGSRDEIFKETPTKKQ
jgi:hypothetical protein